MATHPHGKTRKPETRECELCGAEFTTTHPGKRFCCKAHKDTAAKRRQRESYGKSEAYRNKIREYEHRPDVQERRRNNRRLRESRRRDKAARCDVAMRVLRSYRDMMLALYRRDDIPESARRDILAIVRAADRRMAI